MNNGYPNNNFQGNPFMMQPQQNQNPFPFQLSSQSPIPVMQQPVLNGKVVESADVVRVTEVPAGGYGIFPKADLSEIYVKMWNNNGTTTVMTFKPVAPENAADSQASTNAMIGQVLEKLDSLEQKINRSNNRKHYQNVKPRKEGSNA